MNSKVKSALIGGCVFGTASSLPYLGAINMLCCALLIGAGVLASYLYFKDLEPTTGHLGQGASVGWLAGVFGAITHTIVNVIIIATGLNDEQAAQAKASLEGLPPELPQWVKSFFEVLLSMGTEVSAGTIGITLVVALVLYSIFSTIGGMVGAAMFAKKAPPAE